MDQVRKPKSQTELDLARNIQNNKIGFHKYLNDKKED